MVDRRASLEVAQRFKIAGKKRVKNSSWQVYSNCIQQQNVRWFKSIMMILLN